MRDTGWSWKSEQRELNPELELRYEPGAWGDLLKSAWAVAVADALEARAGQPLRLLDPFAGAPDYPLVSPSAARLVDLPAPRLRELCAPFLARERFPGTARLILAAWSERLGPAGAAAEVFDANPERRERWSAAALAGVRVRGELSDGLEALGAPGGLPPDLVHVDPYDLFERFEALLPAALAAGPRVLLYLFNKAPRSARAHARYQDLRRSLAKRLAAESPRAPRGVLVGRVPSDARLPRAYHEVLLVGPRAWLTELEGPLGALSEALAARAAAGGAFEGLVD